MIQHKIKSKFALQFTSLLEMVDYLRNTPSKWGDARHRSVDRWSGGATFEQCCDLARNGWEKGVRDLDAARAMITNEFYKTKKMNFAGEYPDVGRALAGDPMNMVSRGHDRRNRPSLTLVAAIGGTMGVTAKRMANYGAALTAVIDRIEGSGTRVELLAHWGNRCTTSDGLQGWGVTWAVKQLQDPLDLSALAFSLGHAGAMRVLGFAAMETYPVYIPGYGGTHAHIDRDLIVDCPDPVVFIKGVEADSRVQTETIDGALAYVEEQLGKYEQKEAA